MALITYAANLGRQFPANRKRWVRTKERAYSSVAMPATLES
jgi:hypothetical protein